jgi:hypothetical protein
MNKVGTGRQHENVYVKKERLDKKIDISISKEGKKGINVILSKSTESDMIGILNLACFLLRFKDC